MSEHSPWLQAVIGGAVQALLWIANCFLVACTEYTHLRLAHKNYRVAIPLSLIVFSLATTQAGLSLYQLVIRAAYLTKNDHDYTYPGISPDWVSYVSTQLGIYTVVTAAENTLLMWRLYITAGKGRKVLYLPIFLELAAIAALVLGSQLGYTVGIITAGYFHTEPFALAYWLTSLALNTTLPVLIAYYLTQGDGHLWSIESIPGKTRLGPWVVVESGMLYSISIACMFVLYFVGGITLLEGANILTQVATMVSLLIMMRSGLRYKHAAKKNAQPDVQLETGTADI